MKRILLAVAAVAAVAFPFPSEPALAATANAHIVSNGTSYDFVNGSGCGSDAGAITVIDAGDTVTWTNNCPLAVAHTVTADDETFSRALAANSAVSITFPVANVGVKYHCNIHEDMHGTVIVRAKQSTTTPATKPTTTTAKPTTTTTKPTTTTSTSTSTTVDLDGVFGDDSTTSSSSSTTTTDTTEPSDDNGSGGSSGLVVALLSFAIAGVAAAGVVLLRRMRQDL